MCQCEQADDRDGSCLCSMATGAPAPWCPTAGPSRRSQRRARSLYLHHLEFKTTAGEESVESSPVTVRHQAACASVSKRTMEAACAPWPLAFLPQGVPLRGPPVARSVVPGLCIFVTAGFARLRRRAVVSESSACASMSTRTTGAACAPWSLALCQGIP